MQYMKLGHTGLDVSPICIGCMGFGDPSRGYPNWSLDEEASRPLIRHAIEGGHQLLRHRQHVFEGKSEEILGRALKEFTNRDAVVIATKLAAPMRNGPNAIRSVAQGDHERRSTIACGGSAPTMSICTRSIVAISGLRRKRRWRRSTIW